MTAARAGDTLCAVQLSPSPRFRVATEPPLATLPPPGDLRREYFAGHIPPTEQYRPYFGSGLDMNRIETAIIAANFGRMHYLCDLARETIMLDGHVNALLQKRLNRLGALDWQLTPANGPGIDEKRARERCEEVRENLMMIPNLRDRLIDLAWGNFDGRAVSEIEWYRWGKSWRVRDLHWIHPRRICFGPDRDLRVQDPMLQTGNFRDVGCPVEWIPYKFLTYRPRMFGDYQEREGLAPRTLYWSFFGRVSRRAQLQLMEIFGSPWRIMMPKQGMPQQIPGAQNVDLFQSGFEALINLGYQNTARMPPGVEVQIVQPEQGAGQVHMDVITDVRNVLTKMYVGGIASTEAISGGLGSNAPSVAQDELGLIIATDARRMSEAVEDRLTDAIVIVNHGPQEAAYAPHFAIKTDPPTNRGDELDRIQKALNVGIRVAEEEARERSGYRPVRNDEPYLINMQRTAEAGQVAPPPRAETVYPVGEAPTPGEVPDAPDVALNAPDGPSGQLPALPAGNDNGAGGAGQMPPGLAIPSKPPHVDPRELPGGGAPGAPGEPGHRSAPGSDNGQALSDDTPVDEDVAKLAALMTEMQIAQCEHNKRNRCRICGIERVREPMRNEDGTVGWKVAWKPIGSIASKPNAPPPEPADASAAPAVPQSIDGQSIDGAAPPPANDQGAQQPDDRSSNGVADDDADLEEKETRTARAALLSRLQAAAYDPEYPQPNGFAGPPSEGGNHWHLLERAAHATAIDGEHTHWFQLPDGSLVETTESGWHQHRWEGSDGSLPMMLWGGSHTHAIAIDGVPYATQVDGVHDHQLQGTATTQSGAHSHCLVLPDGATIQSLSAVELLEILEAEEEENPLGYVELRARRLSGIVAHSLLAETVALGRASKQQTTAFGSPDDLVERGTAAFAAETYAFGLSIAERCEGKTTKKAIESAINAATKAWKRTRFADVISGELEHGQWLGALDANYEAVHGHAVKVETFRDLWASILLAQDDVGADPDPAFAKRPQLDAGAAFIERDVVTRDVFEQMEVSAQRRAFTVAGAATNDIARAVKRELVRQVALGADLRDFKKHALQRLESAGWTPVNASHAETVLRTNVMGAYNAGRFRQMTQPRVLAARPYWQVLGVGDDRQRKTHHDIQNKVLRADDPFWRSAYPPFGYNCRCRVRSLSKAQGESIGVSSGSTYSDELPDDGFASGISGLVSSTPVISPEAAAEQVANDDARADNDTE